MKAKSTAKRFLAAALIIAVLAVAMPMAMLASAEEALPTPTTVGGTDFSSSVWYGNTSNLYNAYKDRINNSSSENAGSYTLTSGVDIQDVMLDPTALAEGKVGVYSVNLTFNGDVGYNTTSGTRDGNGTYGNVAIKIGSYKKNGATRPLYVCYRRNQSTLFLMDSYGEAPATFGLNALTGNTSTGFTLTIRIDTANNKVAVWTNDTFVSELTMNLDEFAFASDIGSIWIHNIGSTDGVANSVTFSNIKIYGPLFKGKATFVPIKGAGSTDLTSQLTFSDAALNTTWKSTGVISVSKTSAHQTFFFNGVTPEEGDILYSSFAMTTYAGGGIGGDATNGGMVGMLWAYNGSATGYGYSGARSSWNQFYTSTAYGYQAGDVVINSDATLAGNDAPIILLTKYIVATNTLEVWGNYKVHGGNWGLHKIGTYVVTPEQYRFGLNVPSSVTDKVVIECVQCWKENDPDFVKHTVGTTNSASNHGVYTNVKYGGASASAKDTLIAGLADIDLSKNSVFTTEANVAINSIDGKNYWEVQYCPVFKLGYYTDTSGNKQPIRVFIRTAWNQAYLEDGSGAVAYYYNLKDEAEWTPGAGGASSMANWMDGHGISLQKLSFAFKAEFNNDIVNVYIDNKLFIKDFDLSGYTDFTPAVSAGALLDADGGVTPGNNLKNISTVKVSSLKVTTTENVVRATPYIDTNGNAAYPAGAANGFFTIKVVPAQGYALKAGTLKLGDKKVINAVESDNAGLTFDIESAPAALTAEFVTVENAATAAVLGTSYKEGTGGSAEGVRFLTRFNFTGLTADKIQTANAITVGEKTVADYGVLAIRSDNLSGELTVDNAAFSASGVTNFIYAYTENSIDVVVAIIPYAAETEYTVRGYIKLSDGTVIYTDAFTDTFAAAKTRAGK